VVQRQQGFWLRQTVGRHGAYLHIRVLEVAGSRGVSEGTRLKVAVEESPRGHQVAQVLEIGDQITKTPAHMRLAGASTAETGAQLKSQGTVKWYNPEKGFGFIPFVAGLLKQPSSDLGFSAFRLVCVPSRRPWP
jgi:CspA family cold shock protein